MINLVQMTNFKELYNLKSNKLQYFLNKHKITKRKTINNLYNTIIQILNFKKCSIYL